MDLVERGRAEGMAGNYARALELFLEAHRLDPTEPQAPYEAAWTCLLLDDAARAQGFYEVVDRLVPHGYFTCKTALDTLRRERSGEVGRGAYKLLVLLESEPDKAKCRAILQEILQSWPRFPAAWKALAMLESDDERRLAALDNGLKHSPDPQTRGILVANKALVLGRLGRQEEADRLMGPPESGLPGFLRGLFNPSDASGFEKGRP